MLHLTIGNISERIIVTLNEKKTLNEPIYRFTCTHVVTKEVVQFEIDSRSDLSSYPVRYNEYEVNTAILFENSTSGQWQYVVTELTSLLEMENGKLLLSKPVNFAFTGYEPTTTYKGYGG